MRSGDNPARTGATDSESETPREVDILVRNAYVVSMDTRRRVYTSGAVAIRGGLIVAVGPDREVAPTVRPVRTIDAHGAVVHPGLIEGHVHLCYHNIRWAQQEGASLQEAFRFHRDFWTVIDDETEYTATRLSALEMARNGTTCFLEAGTVMVPDAAATAVEETGIRALLGDPFVKDVKLPDTRERALGILGTELKRNSNPDALVRGVVSLSGLGSASDELELAAKKMADDHGVILNQHQSYDISDVAVTDQRFGNHSLVHFAEIGLLGENCTFSHMNCLRDDEVAPIVESGMSIVWCPIASMLYGIGGTFHGRHLELYKQGVNIVLGCDSANWASSFGLGDPSLLAMLTAREKTQQLDALIAEDIIEMVTVNGARAVGLGDRLGSLEVGKRADLVMHHQDLPEAHPVLDPIRSVAYSGRSKSIDTVIVDGQVIIEKGHSTRVDEQEVYAQSQESSLRLLKRMNCDLPSHRWPHIQ